ncbi:cytochrome P450 [Aspergillus neoniger CBS 115656]|uniref:Cytochrome P450 n=1 Tax=Aspergillus neoniger (strain CBS 115656) TaxID=1448310 RepID=A0A318YFR5_ASPNB|nr:cytochrome P450 [Aspergillus neoniger CBS 115656]PYH32924.1 cytochrome P450 [Aspergillus neoniger CBS 115656]
MALLTTTIAYLSQHIPSILLTILIIHLTRNYFTPGVSRIPGPFLAKLTNLWRFVDVARGKAEITHYRLHQEHGEYVRLGPKVVSVWNVEALKVIYGVNRGYKKTAFYRVQQQLAKGKPTRTLFTSLDEDFHARIKRPVSAAYSMSTVAEFEPFVDSTIRTFFARLDGFAAKRSVFDISTWLQYYAFDVIGEMTFSKRLGFLQQGRDVKGIIMSLEKMFDYAGKIGQIPWLDYVFLKNPLWQLIRGGSTGAVARFARDRLHERLSQDGSKRDDFPGRQKDFLTRFLEAKSIHPDVVDDTQVFSYTVSNVNAGSDTTAISLRAILYYTLKNPRVLGKLQEELHSALQAGKITVPVSWKKSQELPYLDAVIKEALRLHPPVGLLLERVVPAEGLPLPNGPFLPAGTVVGVNPWIIHRHAIFGKEVDRFVPERWLRGNDESEAKFQIRRQNMLGATLTFGAGPRTCIGKNISLLEIYKLIPSLLLAYKVELNDPEAEWEVVNAWFVRQKGMNVKVTRVA